MYTHGKVTSEFSSLVPAVVHSCCQRQGCSLIEWKASGSAARPLLGGQSQSSTALPLPWLPRLPGPAGRGLRTLPVWPPETAGPATCHPVIKKEEQQLVYIEETEINHSGKERKINESLKKPTCKHYWVLHTGSCSRQPLAVWYATGETEPPIPASLQLCCTIWLISSQLQHKLLI